MALTLQQIHEQTEKIKLQAAAQIAELEAAATELKQQEIIKIRDLVTKVAAESGDNAASILKEVAKSMGMDEPIVEPPAPHPQSTGRIGKPNLKKPLQEKLDNAGVKYGANFNLTQLQDLVKQHEL